MEGRGPAVRLDRRHPLVSSIAIFYDDSPYSAWYSSGLAALAGRLNLVFGGHVTIQLSPEIAHVADTLLYQCLFDTNGPLHIAVDEICLCQRVDHVRVEARRHRHIGGRRSQRQLQSTTSVPYRARTSRHGGGCWLLSWRELPATPAAAISRSWFLDNGVDFGSGADDPSVIVAKFAPGDGLTLSQAAAMSGFDHFNWLQTITQVPAGWTLEQVSKTG